jgi:hypothetical protein
LPNNDPEVISLFIDWLDGKAIARGNTPKYLRSLYNLHLLACKLQNHVLMNSTIDMIHYTLYRYNQFFSLKNVMAFCPRDGSHSGLYTVALNTFVFRSILKHRATCRVSGTQIQTAVSFNDEERREIWEATNGNIQVFTDLLHAIQNAKPTQRDPRTYNHILRTERRCWLHVHPEERASYDLEKKFWQGKCDLEFPKPSMDEAIRWETEDSPDEMASDDSQNGKSKIAYQCLI